MGPNTDKEWEGLGGASCADDSAGTQHSDRDFYSLDLPSSFLPAPP